MFQLFIVTQGVARRRELELHIKYHQNTTNNFKSIQDQFIISFSIENICSPTNIVTFLKFLILMIVNNLLYGRCETSITILSYHSVSNLRHCITEKCIRICYNINAVNIIFCNKVNCVVIIKN